MEGNPPLLVLVTLQRACARLIRRGADMALAQHCPLHVLHVVVNDPAAQAETTLDAQTLDFLYALCGEAGAQMTVLTAEVAPTAMAEFAHRDGDAAGFDAFAQWLQASLLRLSKRLGGARLQTLLAAMEAALAEQRSTGRVDGHRAVADDLH